MPTNIIANTTLLQKWNGPTIVMQPIKRTFTISNGYRETLTYKGTQHEIEQLEQQYAANGASTDVEGGQIWTLTVDVMGEDPQVSWEILNEVNGVDLFATKFYKELSIENVMKIRASIDEYSGGTLVVPDFTGSADQIALAKKAWHNKLKGFDTINLNMQVLRVNYVVSNNYEIIISNTNVDKVHSTNTMITVEYVPTKISSTLMPSYTETYTETIGSDTFTTNWVTGWLKGPPQVTLKGRDRTEISQEYRYASYIEDIYGPMI